MAPTSPPTTPPNSPSPAPTPAPRVALGASQIVTRLAGLPGWQLHGDGDELTIEKTFRFPSYLAALAFVNAVGFVAERQDHHPDVLLRYKSCSVRFRTHDVHGISAQDFACAALVDALLSAAA